MAHGFYRTWIYRTWVGTPKIDAPLKFFGTEIPYLTKQNFHSFLKLL